MFAAAEQAPGKKYTAADAVILTVLVIKKGEALKRHVAHRIRQLELNVEQTAANDLEIDRHLVANLQVLKEALGGARLNLQQEGNTNILNQSCRARTKTMPIVKRKARSNETATAKAASAGKQNKR